MIAIIFEEELASQAPGHVGSACVHLLILYGFCLWPRHSDRRLITFCCVLGRNLAVNFDRQVSFSHAYRSASRVRRGAIARDQK